MGPVVRSRTAPYKYNTKMNFYNLFSRFAVRTMAGRSKRMLPIEVIVNRIVTMEELDLIMKHC